MAGRLSQLRANWLAAALLAAGLVLRVSTAVTYRPALFYIDTVRYLYNSGGNDPVGYRLPLKLILAASNFTVVAVVQHLLGLAMAVTIYLVLVRRGAPRWLAALAMAPVLLDAYQLQMEQQVLPDVWFEALVVAGIAVLLARPGIQPGFRWVAAGGLLLGTSATFRQVGEILVLPAAAYLLVACPGWRAGLARAAALVVAFLIPVLGYMAGSDVLVGHFYLSHSGVTTTYGRMAWSADCATITLPPVERGLCPTPQQRAHGPDWLEHSPDSPIRRYYTGPLSPRASALVASFNHAVLSQQPQRVLGTYLTDVGKLFAPAKTTRPGDPPLRRWQFQTSYPYLSPHATRAQVLPAVEHYGGGAPVVWQAGARFLRGYQLDGGYTPGPLLAFCVLIGLAGTGLAAVRRFRRREAPGSQAPGSQASGSQALLLACVLFFWSGAAVLLLADVFEFSWRYQLPALVTLPPAAAAGLAEIARHAATRRAARTEQLAEAGEQVSLRD
jgi:hypothetical protein